MSTRSRIGIIRSKPEGKPPVVESIYCHFDGYPEGVGAKLIEHWTDPTKIDELITLGDLSVLGSEIGEDQGTDWFDRRWQELRDTGDDPRKTWCLAYRRDRGEADVDSRTHALDQWPDYGQECEYVFDPDTGQWLVSSPAQNPFGWNTVAEWDGWITVREAIEAERAKEAQLADAAAES